jgi:hypothetical protein
MTIYKIQTACADNVDFEDREIIKEFFDGWHAIAFASTAEMALLYLIEALNKDYTSSENTWFRVVKDDEVLTVAKVNK